MTKHTTSWPEGRPWAESLEGPAGAARKDGKIADMLQDALEKQHQFDRRKGVVEDLRAQLDEVCAEMIEHGCNADRIYQTRMLEIGLVHARRQLELASQQLDAAIRQLRRVHGQRRGGNGEEVVLPLRSTGQS
jgi:hypothetical protein